MKVQLHAAGLVGVRRGAHRRKREHKRCEGVMLHQEGSHAVWLAGEPTLDLTVKKMNAVMDEMEALLAKRR